MDLRNRTQTSMDLVPKAHLAQSPILVLSSLRVLVPMDLARNQAQLMDPARNQAQTSMLALKLHRAPNLTDLALRPPLAHVVARKARLVQPLMDLVHNQDQTLILALRVLILGTLMDLAPKAQLAHNQAQTRMAQGLRAHHNLMDLALRPPRVLVVSILLDQTLMVLDPKVHLVHNQVQTLTERALVPQHVVMELVRKAHLVPNQAQ